MIFPCIDAHLVREFPSHAWWRWRVLANIPSPWIFHHGTCHIPGNIPWQTAGYPHSHFVQPFLMKSRNPGPWPGGCSWHDHAVGKRLNCRDHWWWGGGHELGPWEDYQLLESPNHQTIFRIFFVHMWGQKPIWFLVGIGFLLAYWKEIVTIHCWNIVYLSLSRSSTEAEGEQKSYSIHRINYDIWYSYKQTSSRTSLQPGLWRCSCVYMYIYIYTCVLHMQIIKKQMTN